MNSESMSMRYARLRLTAVENVKISAEALLRDLQTYPDPEAVEPTLFQTVEFCKTLNRGMPDDKRIILNQR
jgi:hypothetical protein